MPETSGHIELERNIDSIVIGVRHRIDLGDLGPLMKSIQRVGLLQPITITPDGLLVCGRRRLEAVKRMGWRTLRVWVRSGISDELSRLLAQRDDNELRKPLSPVEQAALYEELKKLLAEDAARRQEASRFGANEDLGGDSGGEDSSPPQSPYGGKTREQASTMVSGRLGFQRYEQISALKQIANDPARPANVRELARHELAAIDSGASVHPAYTKVMAALELAEASDGSGRSSSPGDLETLAAEALARARQERARGGGRIRSSRKADAPTRRSLRSFILTWTDLDGWSAHYDAEEVGVKLADKDWETFERVLRETNAFAEVARAARQRDERSASA
jgi:ParB family transcriptional regulator, chromosome partitioning protein